MDGLAACRQIRQRRVPAIALTAGACNEDRMACQEAGMGDFLANPHVAVDLLARIRYWLTRPAI